MVLVSVIPALRMDDVKYLVGVEDKVNTEFNANHSGRFTFYHPVWGMIPMRTMLEMIRRMTVTMGRSVAGPVATSKAPYVFSGKRRGNAVPAY